MIKKNRIRSASKINLRYDGVFETHQEQLKHVNITFGIATVTKYLQDQQLIQTQVRF